MVGGSRPRGRQHSFLRIGDAAKKDDKHTVAQNDLFLSDFWRGLLSRKTARHHYDGRRLFAEYYFTDTII